MSELPVLEFVGLHTYKVSDCGEWYDEYTCTRCGKVRVHDAEDCVTAELLSEKDQTVCVRRVEVPNV